MIVGNKSDLLTRKQQGSELEATRSVEDQFQ
jgi:hypothetical protein